MVTKELFYNKAVYVEGMLKELPECMKMRKQWYVSGHFLIKILFIQKYIKDKL